MYRYLDKECDTNEKKFEENYHAAREHLFRAYYDLFSLICALSIKKIKKYADDYGPYTLFEVYPEYFIIIQNLTEIQTFIARIHSTKELKEQASVEVDPELKIEEKIKKNDVIVNALLNWNNELTARTSLFIDFTNKKTAKSHEEERLKIEREHSRNLELAKFKRDGNHFRITRWIAILIPLATLILGAIISYFILVPRTAEVNSQKSKSNSTTKQ